MLTKHFDLTQVAIFGGLTLLLTFATYFLPLPRQVLPFLIALLPTLLAIGLTAMSEGKHGVQSLLGQVGQWRMGLKWLLIALGLALLMRLAISVLALLLGLIAAIQVRPLPLGQLFLLAVIVTIAALLEEVGWRGYALPKLLTQHSALTASLIIGVVWGSLHLALLLPGMMNEGVLALPTLLAVQCFGIDDLALCQQRRQSRSGYRLSRRLKFLCDRERGYPAFSNGMADAGRLSRPGLDRGQPNWTKSQRVT